MSNNLFRKGLVAATIAGLAATAFAGTPAFAANELVVAPATGTSFNTFATETFKLQTSFASGVIPASQDQLRYQITTDGTAIDADQTLGNAVATPVAVSLDSSNVGYVVGDSGALATDTRFLSLKLHTSSSTTPSTSVKVVAFVDSNNNGTFEPLVDTWNTTVNVGFKKYSDVTASTTITAPLAGDTSATAKVSFDGINNEQLAASDVSATFTKGDGTGIVSAAATISNVALTSNVATVTTAAAHNLKVGQTVDVAATTATSINGTVVVASVPSATTFTYAKTATNVTSAADTGSVTASGVASSIAWSSTDAFTYSVGTGSLVAAQVVKVAPAFKTVAVGTAALATIAARTITTFSSAIVTSNTAGVISATNKVALNKSFQVSALAEDNSNPAVGLAGKTVTYSVTDAALPLTAAAAAAASSPATLTINGVTYTNQAALPGATGVAKLSGVTGADGKLVVSASATNHADGNTIVFNFAAENFTSSITVRETTIALGSAVITSGAASATTAGGTVAVSVKLTDIFGNAVADLYDAKAHFVSSSVGRTTANTQANDVIVPIVGGVATLNIVDNGTGVGTNTYAIQYQLRDAALGGYGANNAVAIDSAYVVNIKAAADLTPGVVALTGVTQVVDANSVAVVGSYKATGAALSTATFAAYDARNPQTVASSAYVTALGTAGATITANVSSSSTSTYVGVAIPTASVTYTLAGAQFKATLNSADVYTIGSITVPSGTAVSVWSNIAGARTVAVTSGAVTSNAVITFPAAGPATGKTVSITAPATAIPGQTVTFSAKLVDKFGNPVKVLTADTADIKLAASGVGTVVIANAVETDETGVVSGYVTTGSADLGSLTITATYNFDGNSAATAPVTATATVKFAAPAAAKTALAVGADQAQVGAAVDVIATATDAAGKPAAGVVVTFDNVGQGYLSAASATTDANGVAKVKLVGNVAGRNTLTATANGATAANAGVSFGAADANISVKGKRATVTYEFAGLAKVVVSVNGVRKPAVYPADDNEGTFSFNLKAGTNKIVVSIAGKTVDSKTVKIKK